MIDAQTHTCGGVSLPIQLIEPTTANCPTSGKHEATMNTDPKRSGSLDMSPQKQTSPTGT